MKPPHQPGQRLELFRRTLDDQHDFRRLFQLVPPPVMRFHARKDIHARREMRFQNALRENPRFLQARRGHKDKARGEGHGVSCSGGLCHRKNVGLAFAFDNVTITRRQQKDF